METNPVMDEDYPNIVQFDPELDELEEMPCATKTMEEVNPDGATF